MADHDKNKGRKSFQITIKSVSPAFIHGEVRPEMVQLAKNLIQSPGFPSDEFLSQTATKIYNQYFSDSSKPSE